MRELPLTLVGTQVEVEVAEKADQALDTQMQGVKGFAGVLTRDGKNYVLLDDTATLSSLDEIAARATPPVEVLDAT